MRAYYENNISTTKAELKHFEKQINTNSLLRLAVIIGGGAILFQIFQLNNIWLLLLTVFGLAIVFMVLVRRQSKLEKMKDVAQAFLRINENEVALIASNKNMYADGTIYEDAAHPYTGDLDIFGPKSLYAQLNRTATTEGEDRLASWLQTSATFSQILERQEAVAELSQKQSWLQQLQTKLLFNLGKKVNLATFLARYLEESNQEFANAFVRFYVRIVPFIFLVGTIISIFVTPIWNYMFGLAILHLLWSLAWGGKVSYFSNRIDKVGSTLIAFSDAIKMIESEEFKSTGLIQLQNKLQTSEHAKISTAFQHLGKLVDKLDVRHNVLVGSVLNMLFLWDFKQVFAILDWKKSYQSNIVAAFDIVAEFEALLSLAILKINYPQWTTPTILEHEAKGFISADNINHPLINPNQAVANTYSAVDHHLALITGSNMAGKSTFLRTIGINAVLAYAGAVTCATSFRLPIYKLVTYMRIKDNLNESTSTFKAELDRMKFILMKVSEEQDAFVLIDEMLRGTNSVDKYLGSKAIIQKLIGMNGKGMVATHDLQLSSLEEAYPGKIKNYHFDIQVVGHEMLFDYKLKNGKCTIFNASLLLKGIGIDVDAVEK